MKPVLLAAILLLSGLSIGPLQAANPDANINKFTSKIDNAAPDKHQAASRSEIKKCQQTKPADRSDRCKTLLQGLGSNK